MPYLPSINPALVGLELENEEVWVETGVHDSTQGSGAQSEM